MLLRVFLAVESASRKKEIRRCLSGRKDIVIEAPGEVPDKKKPSIWVEVTRRICDVLVVDCRVVPDPLAENLESFIATPDAPDTIALLSDSSTMQQAELLAAGCRAVISSKIDSESLGPVLDTVIAERAEAVRERLATRRVLEQPRLADFVSNSPVMQAFMDTVHRVVNTDVSLLLLGETGVGKERLAQAIHQESTRSQGPFVAINCGALPETLLESELFGHERGAFTGATQSRRGCFELAHGGTIFLDEISELPHHLQVNLLRVLQEREVRRLGSEKPIKVDVRIMAATNRSLEAEIEKKQFRSDLYYRLSVMTLTIPPLRERQEDISELIDNYIEYLRPRIGSGVYGIASEAREALRRYAWPGNVRELVNVIERAIILCPGEELGLEELPATVGEPVSEVPKNVATSSEEFDDGWLMRPWREVRREVLERAERNYLAGLLRLTGGKVGETAKRAGMQSRSLFEKMRYYNLCKEDFREPL